MIPLRGLLREKVTLSLGGKELSEKLHAVLDECWSTGAEDMQEGICRWCRYKIAGQHSEDCPCLALSAALDQREALAEYIKAEKHYLRVQGSFRLARKSGRPEVKERMDEASSRLEASLAQLRSLGIEAMLR